MTMNQAPSRVRAVARVGTDPAKETTPATFVRRRRPGYLGPVNVIQLVLLEALVVLILLLLRHSPFLLLGGVVLTALVLVVTFARSGGRWWVERALIRRQYRRRRSSGYLPADDMRLVAMHRLVPDLVVETVDGLGGAGQVGIGRDGAGSFAVVAVVPPAGVNGDALGRLPLGRLASIARDAEQPGAIVQVVRHTVPAPGAMISSNQPAATSYRELMQQYGASTPGDHLTWVAVRFDARSVAEASIGSADELDEIPVMLAALVRRVSKALRRAGLECQVLDAEGLLDALVRSCDLEQPRDGTQTTPATENWTYWQSSSLAHACFWLSGWPGLRDSGALLDEMSGTSAALTSLALILAPYDDVTEIRCLVRVAADPSVINQCCKTVERTVSRGGGGLFRLDGEQAPAVYATAPTGGGAR